MKRARSAGCTTVDVYPNYMSWQVVQSSADAFATAQVFTPIPRIQQTGSCKARAMELLKLEVMPTQAVDNFTPLKADSSMLQFQLLTGTTPTAFVLWSNPNVFAMGGKRTDLTTSGAVSNTYPLVYNFVSNDGKGFLLAADAFFASVDSNATGATNTFSFKLYYRFVDVTLAEFIGIVQSQSQS